MTPAYLDSESIQFFIGGEWVDVSQYVVEDIDFDWGILGNKPSDRTAYIGGMNILLNNSSGLFSPGHSGAMSGFEKGIEARLVLTFEGISYVRFKGRISRIGLPYDAEETSVVPVSVSDWNRVASKQKVLLQGIKTNMTTAKAVEILLQRMHTRPDALDIDYGNEVLASVFTSTDPKSTIYSELAKLALTEFSYIYLRKDRFNGETLRVEDRHARVSVPVSKFPSPLESADNLSLADGDDFALADGDTLALIDPTSITFDNMYQAEFEYGENLINELTVRRNPSRVDANLSVLFALGAPIYIAAGQTLLDFQVSYKDPTGGSGRITGANMQPPVSGTDFKMYVNDNGTGANLTANLSFTVEYGSSGAVYKSMTNTGGTGGWVTVLQARGYAVFLDNPVEITLSDPASIEAYELSTFSINNHYQSNPNITETIAKIILNQNKVNKVVPQKVKLCANISPYLMLAFLNLDIGHLIPIKEDDHQLNDNFFIQSMKGKITQDGFIFFEWGLVDALLANKTYWRLGVAGKSELGVSTIISY